MRVEILFPIIDLRPLTVADLGSNEWARVKGVENGLRNYRPNNKKQPVTDNRKRDNELPVNTTKYDIGAKAIVRLGDVCRTTDGTLTLKEINLIYNNSGDNVIQPFSFFEFIFEKPNDRRKGAGVRLQGNDVSKLSSFVIETLNNLCKHQASIWDGTNWRTSVKFLDIGTGLVEFYKKISAPPSRRCCGNKQCNPQVRTVKDDDWSHVVAGTPMLFVYIDEFTGFFSEGYILDTGDRNSSAPAKYPLRILKGRLDRWHTTPYPRVFVFDNTKPGKKDAGMTTFNNTIKKIGKLYLKTIATNRALAQMYLAAVHDCGHEFQHHNALLVSRMSHFVDHDSSFACRQNPRDWTYVSWMIPNFLTTFEIRGIAECNHALTKNPTLDFGNVANEYNLLGVRTICQCNSAHPQPASKKTKEPNAGAVSIKARDGSKVQVIIQNNTFSLPDELCRKIENIIAQVKSEAEIDPNLQVKQEQIFDLLQQIHAQLSEHSEPSIVCSALYALHGILCGFGGNIVTRIAEEIHDIVTILSGQ